MTFCSLGIHQWEKWRVTDTGDIWTRTFARGVLVGDPIITGQTIIQQRVCPRCGLTQIRQSKTSHL